MLKIETERLILRDFQENDWSAVHQYASNEQILVYEVWGPNTIQQSKDYIHRSIKASQRKPRNSFVLAVTLKFNNQLIGACEARIKLAPAFHAEIGYIIHPDNWKNGFATEAANALMDFLNDNRKISRFYASCDVLNLASQRVLEKCGFERIKIIENHIEMKGRIRDSFLYLRNI